jgi:HlyD family secretion protein
MTASSTLMKFGVLCAVLLALEGCRARPEVRVTRPQRASVEATVSSVNSGTVKAEQVAELAFGAVGRVQQLNVKLGDVVKKGDLLAQVENDDLKSRLQSAKEEFDRSQRLSKSDAMSQSGVTTARANFDAAVTAYEKSLIKAPYDGVIAELNLEVGQLSQITAVIPLAPIRIVDLNPRYVRAEIDEVDLSKIKVGLSARVKILAVRKEPFAASVRKVVPFVSNIREQDRTSEIELTIDNEGVLLPVGASGDVEVITETKNNVLTLSSRALLGRGSDRYVYLLNGGTIRKTPVKVGIFGYTVSEILGGISEGDEVVLPSDKVELKEGLKVKPLR